METDILLSVKNLSIQYDSPRGSVKAIRNVSFDLKKGDNLAIIGESGSGKTTLGMAIIRLLPNSARISSGQMYYHSNGTQWDISSIPESELRRLRWKEFAMVFQAASNSFNPVMKIRQQFYDTAKAHGIKDKKQIRKKARELLQYVQLEPDRILNSYQHELSGGIKQRTLIALALFLSPKFVIMDEATSALDILTQRNIIDLLKRIKQEFNISIIFISHDLSLAAEMADRMITLYAGSIVEIGEVNDIFYNPGHPYTKALIEATPALTGTSKILAGIQGSPPDLIQLPPGCSFHPRCPLGDSACLETEPVLHEMGKGHYVACIKK